MYKILVLVIGGILFVNCSVVKSNEKISQTESKGITPTPERKVTLEPVSPKVKLSPEQQKTLDASLPKEVRGVLEKAEEFEILAEVDNKPDGLSFEPNRIVRISDEDTKKAILEAFYFDASYGETPTACYIPHHMIRARYQEQTAEIEICYLCKRFYVKSSEGKFKGGFDYEENRRSEILLNKIVLEKSVEIER